MTVDVLLAAAFGVWVMFWLFLVFGTRKWPIDKKFRLAQMFAVSSVVMIALLLPRTLLGIRDSMALSDPTSAVLMAILAAALAVVGGIFVRKLLQSRHL